MKKTYIIPQVNTVRLQAESMLAASGVGATMSGEDMGIGYGGIDTNGNRDADVKGNFYGESIFD